MSVLLYLHVVAATVWVGGLITLASLVPVVRRSGADRSILQAMARRFGVISWAALGVLVVTGVTMVMISFDLTTPLAVKVGLVFASVILAAWHTVSAGQQSPRTRGLIQGAILILALLIVGFALAI